jgi:hypothetical protein
MKHIAEAFSYAVDGTYDGELYAHGYTFQQNMEFIKKWREGETGSIQVKFHCYDVVEDNPYKDRAFTRYSLEGINHITIVKTTKVKSEDELKKMFESQMKRNQEKNGGAGAGKSTISPSTASFTQHTQHTQYTQHTQNTQYQASPNTAYGLINRILTPYIEYHSNLEKLESLKTNKTISSSTYKEIKKILDNINIEDDKFINQLKTTVETKRINPVKSDSKTSESDNSSESEEENDKDKEKVKEPTITLRKRLF